MKSFISATSWVLLIYLSYCTILFLLQRQMLFPRDLIPAPSSPQFSDKSLEQIWIDTKKEKVETWFIKPELRSNLRSNLKSGPALIFAHGNAELIDFWVQELKFLSKAGIGVLLVEYPGYGRSGGSPSQESITRTFISAYDMLVLRPDVNPGQVILMGRSLGGGAVCQVAAKRPSAAIILMSAFTSARSFTKKYLVPGFLMRDPFDNLEIIKGYKNPVLVIHGKNDELIPFAHGEKLAKTASKGRLIKYMCGHNDCPPDWENFQAEVIKFLINAGILRHPDTFPLSK